MGDAPPRKRVKIDCGSSRIAVSVPAAGTVADACAAAEARLTAASLGKRRIRTLALPDACELGPDDRVGDVVEDELLLAVFAEHGEGAGGAGGEGGEGRASGGAVAARSEAGEEHRSAGGEDGADAALRVPSAGSGSDMRDVGFECRNTKGAKLCDFGLVANDTIFDTAFALMEQF